MFRYADKNIVYWPVELRQAGPQDEEVQPATVHIGFRLIPRAELREREKRAASRLNVLAVQAAKTTEELTTILDDVVRREDEDVAYVLERMTDWRGIVDGDDQELAFTPERAAALLEYDVFFKPVLAALHEASRAGPRKNWSPGSGGAPAVVQA